MFEDYEMCDGRHCRDRQTCARWMMRCDWRRCNPYVVFNRRPWPHRCPFWLAIPDKHYPQDTNGIKAYDTTR